MNSLVRKFIELVRSFGVGRPTPPRNARGWPHRDCDDWMTAMTSIL